MYKRFICFDAEDTAELKEERGFPLLDLSGCARYSAF